MDAGEGTKIVAIFGAVASAGALGLMWTQKLAKKWARSVDQWPSDEGEDAYRDNLAAALVPEYAAARLNSCNCRGCRRRSNEPCSDFDGD